jgi:hypothetical protein
LTRNRYGRVEWWHRADLGDLGRTGCGSAGRREGQQPDLSRDFDHERGWAFGGFRLLHARDGFNAPIERPRRQVLEFPFGERLHRELLGVSVIRDTEQT